MGRRPTALVCAAVRGRAMAALAAVGLLAGSFWAAPARAEGLKLRLEKVDQEPTKGRVIPSPARLQKLEQAVAERPRDRAARFALVQAHIASNKLDDALQAANAWRQVDAYNLVVVRLLGDIHAARGDRAKALRTWSAVVELLGHEASAQRALASALKQAGEMKAACERLQAAVRLRADDPRLGFELADCLWRTDRRDEAQKRLEAIVADEEVRALIRHPAQQRLALIHATARRDASRRGDRSEVERRDAALTRLDLPGGMDNHIKVYLTWDTNRSDVDLWVTNPAGEKIFYSHRKGRHGGALFGDVTDGYGPESFTAARAIPGTYTVQVNYFGTTRNGLKEARGEVAIVLNEGTADESREILPYRLYRPGQTVTVARVVASRSTGGKR